MNIDRTGGPQNWSVATWHDGEKVSEYVSPDCGPFDTPLDAFASAMAYIDRAYGVQLMLPL